MAWKRLIFLFLFYSSISVAEEQELKFKKLLTLNEPWGSTFINDDALLITEKSGKIKLINLLDNNIKEINHNLKVLEYGQGGLLDIIFKNNSVWVSYTEKRDGWKTSTSIARGMFDEKKITFKNIFQAFPPIDSMYHFGSRLAIKEDYLLSNYLEKTNEPYAVAKIAGVKLCESYNLQYKLNYKCLMPCNAYGINDNYDLSSSHFFPALIRKIIDALSYNKDYIKICDENRHP